MSAMMGRHSAVEPVQVVRRTSMTARSSASVGESMPAQQQQHMNPSVKFTNPQSTNNIPQRAGKYSTFHQHERQTQPHPHSVGHGRNGRARGGRVTRTVDHLLGAGVCTDLGAWDIARHAPSQRVFVAQIAGRKQVALPVAGSLGAAGRCWQQRSASGGSVVTDRCGTHRR